MREIALVGNPNTGKTTFLNCITKANNNVGNWHGVTTDASRYKVNGRDIMLVDLAGTYSLAPFSLEEKNTADFLLTHQLYIYNVCEFENLRRNLLLTMQLLELGQNVQLVINNFGKNYDFDSKILQGELGVKVDIVNFFNKNELFKVLDGNISMTKSSICNANYLNKLPYNEILQILKRIELNAEHKLFLNKFSHNCCDCHKCILTEMAKNQKPCNNQKANLGFSKNYIDKYVAIRILEGYFDYLDIYKINLNDKEKLISLVDESIMQKIYTFRYEIIDCILDKCNYLDVLNKVATKIDSAKGQSGNCEFIEKKDRNKIVLNDNFKSPQNDAQFEEMQISSPNKNICNRNFVNHKYDLNANKKQNICENSSCMARLNTYHYTNILDKVLLNKYLAFPIFLLIILAIFYINFGLVGSYLSSKLEYLINNVFGGVVLSYIETLNIDFVYSLFRDGIIGGVGSILAFLPQVLILFLFLTILQECGYLARLAYLLEGICEKIGLSGKSIFTFIMGFGCTATAILTANNLDDKNTKLKTILTTPFMSCSAKLPVFAVLGGAFFQSMNVLVIFALYLLSALVGFLFINILDKTLISQKKSSFLLEFPPYRVPKMKIICNSLYINMKNFILKIAGFIFIFSILIWFLQSFSMSFNYIDNNNEKSILQTFCEFIAPIFAPLGFGDWGAVSALFAGLIAKELIISSIGITNNVGANDLDELVGASILDSQAVVHFSSMSIVSFLVFCLLYTPCIATIGSMRSLIGSKWTAFSVFVQFAIAYSVSFFVYRLIKLFSMYGFIHSLFVICVISLISFAFFWIFVKIFARTHCKT